MEFIDDPKFGHSKFKLPVLLGAGINVPGTIDYWDNVASKISC